MSGPNCTCYACLDDPSKGFDNPTHFMVVCARCGNKRCPHAEYHGYACTNSNDVGQVAIVGDARVVVPPRYTVSEQLAQAVARIATLEDDLAIWRQGYADAVSRFADLAAERDAARADYAACAHAAGIEYVPDCGATAPGPVEAVVKAIEETRRRVDFLEERLAFRSAVKGHLR